MIIIIMIIPSENRLIHESVRNSDVLVRRRSPPGPANDAERNVQIVHFHTVRLPWTKYDHVDDHDDHQMMIMYTAVPFVDDNHW